MASKPVKGGVLSSRNGRCHHAKLGFAFDIQRFLRSVSDHFVRQLAAVLDLGWVSGELSPFYSRTGRPSVDPELLIRMLIVGYVFAIRSERQLCSEVQVNLAYRWFCGLGIEDRSPLWRGFSLPRRKDCTKSPSTGPFLCSEDERKLAWITLHVGLGTFAPITTETIEQHRMHAESFSISPRAVRLIRSTRAAGQRSVAVGSTSLRVLEAACAPGKLTPQQGWTDIYIKPGYQFGATDALLTNFHLPRSTLLVLVCAFATSELIFEAYQQAITRKYRFYSYGDAMLIL